MKGRVRSERTHLNWRLAASRAEVAPASPYAHGRREALVSFVPRLEGQIRKKLIRRGVADSGIRNRNVQVS